MANFALLYLLTALAFLWVFFFFLFENNQDFKFKQQFKGIDWQEPSFKVLQSGIQ